MAITEVTTNHDDYVHSYSPNTVRAEETENAEKLRTDNNTGYLRDLQTKLPDLTLASGSALLTKDDGRHNLLTIHPKILQEMQADPEKEKYYMQRLRDFESATKWVDGFITGMGFTNVFRHGYMDENGNFSSVSYNVRKDELNEKLRREASENTEKWIEKAREEAIEKRKEQLEPVIKETDKVDRAAGGLISDKLAESKDGKLYLYDTDIQTIIEAVGEKKKEDKALKGKTAGRNIDFQI